LPGGRLEQGEDPNIAILREVLEETGLEVTLGQPYEIFKWYDKQEKVDKVAITYLAKFKSGKLKLSSEHEFSDWYEISKLPKDVMPWVKRSLTEAKKLI
jgi:8-oxo-dGTP diphosphatase